MAWSRYPAARRALAAFPPGPPIFLTGTHRSGTTWSAEMLAEPGLWYVHEPFGKYKGHWHEWFTYARPGEPNGAIDDLFARAIDGRLPQLAHRQLGESPLSPMRLMRPPIRRAMVKDPLACLMTAYLTDRFGLGTVALIRHPVGFVASLERLGWDSCPFLAAFLESPPLMQDHLEPWRDAIASHTTAESLESKAVFAAVLNRVIADQAAVCGAIVRRFEDLCLAPIDGFRELFGRLDLPYTDATRSRHESLCGLDGERQPDDPGQYRTHAVRRDSAAMAYSWAKHVEQAEADRVRAIWEAFGLPFYPAAGEWDVAALRRAGHPPAAEATWTPESADRHFPSQSSLQPSRLEVAHR